MKAHLLNSGGILDLERVLRRTDQRRANGVGFNGKCCRYTQHDLHALSGKGNHPDDGKGAKAGSPYRKARTMSEDEGKGKGFFGRIFKRDRGLAGQEGSDPTRDDEPSRREDSDASSETGAPGIEGPLPQTQEQDQARRFSRIIDGLRKTRIGLVRSLDRALLGEKALDDRTTARLEEVLVRADVGVKTAYELLESVTDGIKRKELADSAAVMAHLKSLVLAILSSVEAPLQLHSRPEPFVVMVVGVNGSGKTTTIAKIAARYKAGGRKVLMAAGDTFRAAAVDQIEIWAERIGCPVVKGGEKADPSSVAYEAVEKALAEGIDLVLVDTAGRLHTRVPLMEQLKKMKRTLNKLLPDAPHETLLVMDASNGQNAILQARTFNEAIPVTGIAVTKLDGTSKGGVLVGVSNELKIPVRYIGIGEKVDDLRDFNARDFTEALFAGADDSEGEM